MNFKTTISGIESIQKDIDEQFMPRVEKAVEAGLNHVASDMVSSLQEHIQHDVYDAYTPTDYIRRGYNGGMIDPQFMDYAVQNNVLTFDYEPPTSPSYWRKTETWNDFDDSDDMIRAIQSGRRYPTYGDIRRIGQRLFWSNFVKEQFADGKAEASFVSGINAYDKTLRAKADRGTNLDSEDVTNINGLRKAPSKGAPKTKHWLGKG